MDTFKDGQPEEFLYLLKNFKIAIDGTGTTTTSGWINYLRTMLHVKALRKIILTTVSIWWCDQQPPQNYPGGFNRVFLPDQCALQAKARNEARNA